MDWGIYATLHFQRGLFLSFSIVSQEVLFFKPLNGFKSLFHE